MELGIFEPVLGSFLPIRWQCLLHQEPVILEKDALAALELEDPAFESVNQEGEDDADAPVYILVKVIQNSSNDDSVSRGVTDLLTAKYRVNVGEEEDMDVSGAFLYALDTKFKNLISGPLCELITAEFKVSNSPNEENSEQLKQAIDEASNLLTANELLYLLKRFYMYECYSENKKIPQQVLSGILKYSKRLDNRARNYRNQLFELNQKSLDHVDGGGFHSVKLQMSNDKCWHNWQPREAVRFMIQATWDFESAQKEDSSSPEWACFKCHQAAEKALKAVCFMYDAEAVYTHDLHDLAGKLDGLKINLVNELVVLCCRSDAMRYPTKYKRPDIPNNIYRGRPEKVIPLAKEIVRWCYEHLLAALRANKMEHVWLSSIHSGVVHNSWTG